MRYWVIPLVAVLAVGFAIVGCTKPADEGTAPVVAAPSVPPVAPSSEPADESASDAGETLVLTDPDGQELALTTAGADETIVTDLGLPIYPDSKVYTIDLTAMTPEGTLPPEAGEAGPELMDLMVQAAAKSSVVLVTEDSFDDVLAWSKENFAGWTIGEPEVEGELKTVTVTSPEREDVEVALADAGEYRAILVNDGGRAADLNAQIEELMMKALSEQMEAAAAASATPGAPADPPQEGTTE